MKRLMVLLVVAVLAGVVHAETVQGRIAVVSKQAGTIQLDVKDKDGKTGKVVVRTSPGTSYEGASGLADLGPPDLIEVERDPGQPAKRIKKIVFGLPPGVEIDANELVRIMTSGRPYQLFDARPGKRFGGGHIPGARSAYPKDKAFLDRLPADKGMLLVFYCGGPTCPYTAAAVKQAAAAGYTNLKGYQAGLPGWKKAKLPVHAESGWLAKNLDAQHVVLDAREPVAAGSHISGAASMPVSRLQALRERFIAEQKVALLPGVTDQRAPIIVYADSHTSREALLAYKELREWGYGQTTVLRDGFAGWQAADLPTAPGAAGAEIVYLKKLAPGAIGPEEFIAVHADAGKLVIDVRTAQETAGGMITGARHVPLDQLEDAIATLPPDKEVLIYCANGIRAEMAHQTLNQHGIANRFLNETITVNKDGSFKI